MEIKKDALDKLIVNEDENPDIDLLAEIVSKYLRFGEKSGEIIFNENFYKNLKDWQKVLVYLLGRKVILIKKLKKDFDERISPKELSDFLGIPSKSIARCGSRELKGIIKSESGKYFIPNYNLHKCREKIQENGRTNSKKKN